MEELEIINGYRLPEIHTIILWDKKNYINGKEYILKNLPDNFEIIFQQVIDLDNKLTYELIKSIYLNSKNRVKNNGIYLIIIKDNNPIYKYEKATSCWQVLNSNMKKLKENIRENVYGSKKNYMSVHTSYNSEESLLVLEPLKLTKYLIPRIKFNNFKELFETLNSYNKLKYLIQRSEEDINLEPKKIKGDIDILVNDYYYFKSITGARSKNKIKMRERDDSYNIQSTININNIEIAFDIRYIGDDYIDSNWEKNMLNNKILKQMNNLSVYIPNDYDYFYSLLYHIIIQKPSLLKSKHIPKLILLGDKIGINIINNKKNLKNLLDKFIEKHNYKYKKPKDKNVNFFV